MRALHSKASTEMKHKILQKKLLLLAAVTLGSAASVNADSILGIYAGGGVWDAAFEGSAGIESADLGTLGHEKNKNNYVYVALEHPVPLIPNIRLQHTDVSSEATGTLQADFQIGDQLYSADLPVDTDFDLRMTDAYLYYELLDNWVTLDAGIIVRKLDFDGVVTGDPDGSTGPLGVITDQESISAVVPMLYGKARFDLPFSGWALGVEYAGLEISDHKLTDASYMLAYESNGLVMDLGIELGYRNMELKVDTSDIGDLQSDIELGGPYLGLTVHF